MLVRRLPAPFALILCAIGAVRASVECLPSYHWTYNRQNKSPCDVASGLLSECNSAGKPFHWCPETHNPHTLSLHTNITHIIDSAGPLQPLSNDTAGDAYYDPSRSNKLTSCMCNTITYSLRLWYLSRAILPIVGIRIVPSGRNLILDGISWHAWADAKWSFFTQPIDVLTRMLLTSYPEQLPPGLDVPTWAYMDVTTIDYFSISAAFRNATSNATQTDTQALSTPTAAPPNSSGFDAVNGTNINNSNVTYNMMPSSSQSDNSKSESKSSHVDIPTLIGAITGSVSGLVIVVIAILRYMAFRKTQKAKKEAADDEEKRGLVDKERLESVAEKKEKKHSDPEPKDPREYDHLNSEVELGTDANGDTDFRLHDA
ncbi:LOW QUALITY PROTEIN: hypothetical protein CVT25_006513 [Psilocybe cyanescens]|uniref:Uncharacterized protein n=1 Tax=Psilocybe cyanescens TaxID=93625 RepID=A0A409XEH5_PSICY|nr:LOW QUALITY PROTEIN: hypothetical protein CVT25_006513 [Psilocybe cyanescens]